MANAVLLRRLDHPEHASMVSSVSRLYRNRENANDVNGD